MNRTPSDNLKPWLSRLVFFVAGELADKQHSGLLFNDAANLRTAVAYSWRIETKSGVVNIRDETVICGQHSCAMPTGFDGSAITLGAMLKPGAIRKLGNKPDETFLDRVAPASEMGLDGREITDLYTPGIAPEQWIERLEDWLRHHISSRGIERPDALSQRFEEAAFIDPNESIADFAERHGVSMRTLQRVVKRDFGLTPKQVMRRARAMDFAARLCGVGDGEGEESVQLRYFDQSHLIREFASFFRMTPRRFVQERHDLLSASLQIRQDRRLELLEEIAPGKIETWMRNPIRSRRAASSAA
ncbi:helix-turn-helix domain-containing protein [Altererythrobacter aurantiacus]|uniref:Helix-turn-helix domain-containing protein n=1 Tax=Parapontixanthobacter aurantiacus TaxID=1463599 RepID=A0A844ZKC1_9SPHN|nr:helix-turn-helix domain-containing protein [Parapontixanthobacter aurantiacus]MXO86139.1 helix-turn-helix domain-containing protein [Parapontixanthobacter aurantiacus]